MSYTATWPVGSFEIIRPASIKNGSLAYASEPHKTAYNQIWVVSHRPNWGQFYCHAGRATSSRLGATNEQDVSVPVWLPPFCSYVDLGFRAIGFKASSTIAYIKTSCPESGDDVAMTVPTVKDWYLCQGVDSTLPTNTQRSILARDSTPMDEWCAATLTLEIQNAVVYNAYWKIVPPAWDYVVP